MWEIVETSPSTPVTVDLQERRVTAGDFSCSFEVDDYVRWRLLEGLDDIGITLENADAINEFEKNRPSFKPILN